MKNIELEDRSKELFLKINENDPCECVISLDEDYFINELTDNELIDADSTKDGFYCSMTTKGKLYLKQNPKLKNPAPIKGINVGACGVNLGVTLK